MNNTILYKILRWSAVLIALIFLINFGADDADTTASFAQIETAVSKALLDAAKDEKNEPIVSEAEADKLERFYGLNAEDFANSILYIPTDGVVYVEELLLIEVRDEAQKEAVLQAVNARLETQKKTFENYNMFGQYEKLTQKVHIEIRGNFILFIVNCDAAYDAFLSVV